MAEALAALPVLAPSESPSHRPILARKILWIGIIAIIAWLFVMGCLCFCFKRKPCKGCKLSRKGMLDAEKLLLKRFQLEDLLKATNNFSKEFLVGSGAFGNVYVGSFEAEGTLAIKKLHPYSCTSIEEFRNEVRLISKVKHENLVRLAGFCEESGYQKENIMVYEYVSNGSLLDYLMGRGGRSLTWKQRVNIAIGAAKGIAHLHDGVKPSIIHRDIKPSNILVTENFEAKVSDFGLVKAGPDGDQSHVSSLVKGTPGYLDPAYCASFHVSPFTDVYSFGIILLQLVSGRRAVDSSRGQSNIHIVDWARPSLEEGRIDEILDANLLFEECNMAMMLKMGQLGLRCAVNSPKERPTMTQVWQELEAALHSVEILIHKQPLSTPLEPADPRTVSTAQVNRRSNDDPDSQNSVSIDGIELQRFHVDMDNNSSFQSPSLRGFEYSLSMDAAANNLRSISEETTSTSMYERSSSGLIDQLHQGY